VFFGANSARTRLSKVSMSPLCGAEMPSSIANFYVDPLRNAYGSASGRP
jgi:hypothetical protein